MSNEDFLTEFIEFKIVNDEMEENPSTDEESVDNE